jgi:hypothetical protein
MHASILVLIMDIYMLCLAHLALSSEALRDCTEITAVAIAATAAIADMPILAKSSFLGGLNSLVSLIYSSVGWPEALSRASQDGRLFHCRNSFLGVPNREVRPP